MTVVADRLFRRGVIGMIHLQPLPGVPGHPGMDRLIQAALRDAEALLAGGVSGLLLENMHDFPCIPEREMGPEVAAAMTRAAVEVRRLAGPEVPMGIQVLFAANRTAVAVAAAAGLDFIRAESWSYGHLADKGWAEASAGQVVRYRKLLAVEGLLVLADAKKKHAAHAVTADLPLPVVAANLELQQADAVVVTGLSTGMAPDPADLAAVRGATGLPLVIGSGVTAEALPRFGSHWDALIVGTSLKEEGDWRRPVDPERVGRLVRAVKRGAGPASTP